VPRRVVCLVHTSGGGTLLMLERLIHMRLGAVLTIALAVSLAACGDQSAGTAREQSGVTGQVHLGPQCPVETEADRCADKPAAGSWVTVAKQRPGDSDAGGEVVARTTTNADGRFRVNVAPGNYVVTANAGMSCEPMDARVTTAAYSQVDIPCDTGIR
jgi:phage tail sheath gpL-like